MIRRPRRMAAATVAVVLGLGVGACGGSTEDPAGREITLWTVHNSFFDYVVSTIPQFEQQSGIKVNVEQLPEASYLDKLRVAQTGKATTFDVFEAPQSLTAQYDSLGGIVPLTDFVETKAGDLDFPDVIDGLYAGCNQAKTPGTERTLYCLPVFSDTTMIYYNRKMFAEAGIAAPPKTWSDLAAAAVRLTNGEQAGWCTRAVPGGALYTGQMMMLYYLPYNSDNQARFLDSQWRPMLTSPEGLAFARDYQTLMTRATPKGIASYDYADCMQGFQQGKIAMWMDASVFAPDVLDSSKSKVSDDTGFTFLPCPPTNPEHCGLTAPWGIFLNKNSTKQDAGWELIKWITSKKVQQGGIADKGQTALATRTSVLESDLFGSTSAPKDLGDSMKYGLNNVFELPNAQPYPNMNEVEQQLGVALSEIISKQKSPEDAFANAQDAIEKILRRDGKLS